MTELRSRVIGCGAYLPSKILTNAALASMVDTSDEWITERSGIKARHIAAEGEKTSDLGVAAAIDALNDAGIEPSGIDFIILATSTPDLTFPATATTIQASLGITHGFAFDLQAVCSGFAYALASCRQFPARGPRQACACYRRGNVLAHPRLGGPQHLRPVRRWCGRGRP